MEEINKSYPLILVFYLDKELMRNPDIINPYVEHVGKIIDSKEANILAFFLPTDGEERIECINPIQIEKPKMEKIMKMVDHISKNFLDINNKK